jgi:MFS family permease
VPNHREPNPGRFDLPGFLLAGAGLASLLVGLERTPSHGWSDPTSLGLMVTGLALLVTFVVVELKVKEPLLDLRLLKDRNFAAGNAMLLISTGALMGILFLTPLMLQQVMGLTATESGLVTLAQVIGMMVTMPFGARLYAGLGARPMMAIGFTVLAAATFAFSTLTMDSSLWWYRGILFFVGVAMALIMVPSQTATFESISFADTANASSVVSTMRQFASAAGVAVMSTILTSRINAQVNQLDPSSASPEAMLEAAFTGYDQTFVISALVSVAGIFLVVMYRKNSGKLPPKLVDDAAAAEGVPVMAH